MTITLIGYRGSGKSSVAGPLAERLGWTAADADEEIERRAGRSIREIFAADGEHRFRQLEREVLAELLQRDRLVLAAGGGAVMDPQTRREMRLAGPVVWLQADVATLQRRIERDRSTADRRPNLTRRGGAEEIAQLLAQREPLYRECATAVIRTDGRRIPDIVEEILPVIAAARREDESR